METITSSLNAEEVFNYILKNIKEEKTFIIFEDFYDIEKYQFLFESIHVKTNYIVRLDFRRSFYNKFSKDIPDNNRKNISDKLKITHVERISNKIYKFYKEILRAKHRETSMNEFLSKIEMIDFKILKHNDSNIFLIDKSCISLIDENSRIFIVPNKKDMNFTTYFLSTALECHILFLNRLIEKKCDISIFLNNLNLYPLKINKSVYSLRFLFYLLPYL